MNYYGARKRESDGRYDYTCMNDRKVWPIGYCHAKPAFDPDFIAKIYGGCPDIIAQSKQDYDDEFAKFGKHYHTDGHATEEEACDCYRKYILDHDVKMWKRPLDEDRRDEHRKCGHGVHGNTSLTCGKWTMNYCEVGNFWSVYLCDEHMTQEIIEKIYPKITWSASSY